LRFWRRIMVWARSSAFDRGAVAIAVSSSSLIFGTCALAVKFRAVWRAKRTAARP